MSDELDLNSAETHATLKLAREKGERLLAGLLAEQASIEANPGKLSPEQLEQGRYAMKRAIAAARRMLANLDDAQRIASLETN